MCDMTCDGPDFYHLKVVRARKSHRCCACAETIAPKNRYRRIAGTWDGEFATYKQCLRCAETMDLLISESGEVVPIELDCGEVYEGNDPRMYELAFSLPGDFEAGSK